MMIDWRILRGNRDIAVAIEWMALCKEHLLPYEKLGCFEYHASGQGIAVQAQNQFADTEAVFKAFVQCDEQAQKLVVRSLFAGVRPLRI